MADDSLMDGPLDVDKKGDEKTEETSYDSLQEEPMEEEKERDSLMVSATFDKVKDGDELSGDQNLTAGDDKTPEEGMLFKSYGEACYFYKQYAQRVGFAATVRRSAFTKQGQCHQLILACCRWGKGRAGERYQSRLTAKTNCQASIRLRLRGEGLLRVEKVTLEHNHELNPSLTQVLRCFKILSNNKVLRPYRSSHTLMEADGHENLPSVETDHNHSTERRYIKLGQGDVEAIQQFFTQLQTKNSNFFYLIDLDKEGCLSNVFWADSRSRTAYKYFGDVITFDTTYLTGMPEVPLVLFLGVNHHGQSVLLGCGLLSDETIETYVWLFKAWLACMSGKRPNAIVTDHCKAIQGATAEVFLGVRHRLCLWHIMKKMPEKLRGFSAHKEVRKALKKAVYDSSNVDEFEEIWKNTINRHELEGCEWLSSLYKNRNCWVPVFLKDTFWAGLSVTQRSETVIPFFDGFVSPKTSLRQFFSIYESALQSKYEKEAQADSESSIKNRLLVSKFYMEEQVSALYTFNMFKMFQDELKATMYCDVSLLKEEGLTSTFEVKESVFVEDGKKTKSRDIEVLYYADELKVQCACGSFQFRGILCRHALAVLKLQQVYEIPSQYILNRWRKDYKRLHALSQTSNDVVSKNPMERYDNLSMRCLQLLDVGSISDDKYLLALKLIKEVEKHLLDDSSVGDGHQKSISVASMLHENSENLGAAQFGFSVSDKVPDSSQGKRRGRPPKKRKESDMEVLARPSNGMNFSAASLDVSQSDVLRIGATAPLFGTHTGTQGGSNLMEEVNLNDLSSNHFGMHVNPQHHIASQLGIRSNNMIQGQYNQPIIDNQSRSQWLYQHLIQDDQLPRGPPGGRNG